MERVRSWLSARFPDFEVPEKPLQGTFGLVWILTFKLDRAQRMALKMVDPTALKRRTAAQLRQAFEREMRLWFQVPMHPNVLPAGFLERAEVEHAFGEEWQEVPLVRMQCCDGTLRDWVGSPTVTRADALLAIAQTCNGLLWLNEHGIDGHGDLKPENLLRVDFCRDVRLTDERVFPSVMHPWQIRVADLGWANAFRECGEFHTAWRPYLAPERLDKTFVPRASDTFALGVIAAELLTGKHPTGLDVERVGKWNDRDWRRWATGGVRAVDAIEPGSLKDAVVQCLESDPAKRPTLTEVLDIACQVVRREHGIEAKATLELWNTTMRSAPGNRAATQSAWGGMLVAQVSAESEDRAIRDAETRFRQLPLPTTPTAARDWLDTAKMLWTTFLRSQDAVDREAAGLIAKDTVEFVIEHFHDLDLREVFGYRPKTDENDLQGFEPWEPLWGYGIEALRVLAQVRGSGSSEVRDLHERLDAKYQEKQMNVEEFIQFMKRRAGVK